MSALAMILAKSGYSISGSDTKQSKILKQLTANQIKIFQLQEEKNIDNIYEIHNKNIIIILSSAISQDNSELQKAIRYGLKLKHRSDILASLINNKTSLVISGSHGKTTTSTYIATLLSLANHNPSAIIGGIVPHFNSNYNFGDGEFLVAEADESDGTLIKFNPYIGIITNIELEHVDHYKNLKNLLITMQKFSQNCRYLIANYDCNNIRQNINPYAWYSSKIINNIDFSLIPIESNGYETFAEYYEKGILVDHLRVPIPGLHNLSNTIGAIATCRLAGITFKDLKEGISMLQSPIRRFDFKGLWNERIIVDDYAHHPSEIEAALSMAYLTIKTKKHIFPISPQRLVSIFQPHRFSRTEKFQKQFARTLINSDLVFIAPIYAAGEKEIRGVTHHSIASEMKKLKPSLELYTPNSKQELITLIQEKTKPKDLILNMGAGDINMIWSNFLLQSVKNQSIKRNYVA